MPRRPHVSAYRGPGIHCGGYFYKMILKMTKDVCYYDLPGENQGEGALKFQGHLIHHDPRLDDMGHKNSCYPIPEGDSRTDQAADALIEQVGMWAAGDGKAKKEAAELQAELQKEINTRKTNAALLDDEDGLLG